MRGLAQGLMVTGAGLAVLGLLLYGLTQYPAPSLIKSCLFRLGHLPGDIRFKREHFQFYFPFSTCLLVSGLFTFLSWLIRTFFKN